MYQHKQSKHEQKQNRKLCVHKQQTETYSKHLRPPERQTCKHEATTTKSHKAKQQSKMQTRSKAEQNLQNWKTSKGKTTRDVTFNHKILKPTQKKRSVNVRTNNNHRNK